MKVLVLTNEYPPYIYGGAGVHVEYLSRGLAKLCDVDVRCFGDQLLKNDQISVKGFQADQKGVTAPAPLRKVFDALQRCLAFNLEHVDADVVHVHTWYSHLGGILAKLNYSIPLIVTVHSLEPLRPWKREQLAGGYDFTCWIEKTALELADAVIAVSSETKTDILRLFDVQDENVHVIHNGIDPNEYTPVNEPERLQSFGIRGDRPYVLFVGRLTKQKGMEHFVNAIKYMDPGFQVVMYASSPDTPKIASEMERQIKETQAKRSGVIWIKDIIDLPTKIALYSHAGVFCCPSVYEPFGIINLEAMACETAVVASAVGGIKEVVRNGETGFLVPVERRSISPFDALDPDRFARDLAEPINRLMRDDKLRKTMGRAGRARVLKMFSWESIAQKTYELYEQVLRGNLNPGSPIPIDSESPDVKANPFKRKSSSL